MAEGRPLSKNQAAVHYLVRCYGSQLGRTRLMKALYLADLYSVRAGYERVSSYQFVYHKHGPFAQSIYNDVELLERFDLLKEHRTLWKWGPISYYEPKGSPVDYSLYLTSSDVLSLGAAGRRASEGSLDDLLEEVYATGPMARAAARGKGAKIDLVADRSDKTYLPPSRDRIARSVQELDRGEGKDAREVLNARRARHVPDRRGGA